MAIISANQEISSIGRYDRCLMSKSHLSIKDVIKNDINPSIMQLFRVSDKQIMISSNANLPHLLREWVKYYAEEEEENDINIVFYSSSARIIKARLELIGYSLANAKIAYCRYLDSEISKCKKLAESHNKDFYQSQLKILSSINLDKWLSIPKEIHDKELIQSRYKECFSFSCVDLNVTLRLVLEVLPENENVIYNVTDLILHEYFDIEEDLVKYASNISSQDYCNYYNSKCIILTEGKSDTLILSESLKLLYPHLSDYFTFMDFDDAKVGGGAGSLATMVKSFSGAGIINRVVAVFDNDTAARAALKKIRNSKISKISKNIKVYTLPDIEILKDYPTIGPSGKVKMNVNGLAGGIEAYLGNNSLTDDDGNFYPVQWTGLDFGLQEYQGEIIEKDKVQRNFKEQLNACKENSSLIDNYDWSGIKAILEEIFDLFHEDDGQEIISWAEKYNNS